MPTSLEDKQNGFMNAIGVLFEECSSTTKTDIKTALNKHNLHNLIQIGGHDASASDEGVNPCDVGQTWNPATGRCE